MSSSAAGAGIGNRNLRDYLLAALAVLPGTRQFHLHVLVSSPRKCTTIFPFAKPRPPRVYVQDILVILSEEPDDNEPGNADESATPASSSRVIVTAMEAAVYNIPHTSSAIFYVSKVDSSGQASAPSPTAALVRALLKYYVDPATRPVDAEHLWVQLFARAQSQYLFPDSADFEGKKPLSDTKLCAWWRRVLTRVVADVMSDKEKVQEKEMDVKMYYILPGYSEEEAEHTLRIAATTPLPNSTLQWKYGHPYSQANIPLPCPPPSEGPNLGHYIPSFDDDPKSRFIDEIAYTTDGEIKSPQRKRAKTEESSSSRTRGGTRGQEQNAEGPLGELGKVSADEFWERMSFRQECVAGAVTGFFTVIATCKRGGAECGESQRGVVSSQVNKRVLTTLTGVEFSTVERARKATETVEAAIKGLCEGIPGESGRKTPEPSVRLLEVPRTPPRGKRKMEEMISPNPFPEPVGSVEGYLSDIYGSVITRNAAVEKRESSGGYVRVLNVRRKIKK
ncbi:hypothetical protein CPC08DRAFT_629316 [Agrocybe pediades]|nr:hypothetical protein CPC08DRAFT_629316 [Agrocybe pediades]